MSANEPAFTAADDETKCTTQPTTDDAAFHATIITASIVPDNTA